MKRSFLFDLGFHHGEGLEHLKSLYGVDRKWTVFAFEPNSTCQSKLIRASMLWQPLYGLPFAAAVKAGPAFFLREPGYHGTEDGQGSHLAEIPLDVDCRGGGEEEVWCVDFPLFLRALIPARPSKGRDDIFVIVKMDIEGAEYPLLRAMLADGSIDRVDVLHVEFHDRILPDETAESTAALKQELEARVKVVDHW